MLFHFGNVLIFLIVGAGFVFVSLTLGSLLRPHVPNQIKQMTYECGEIVTEDAWVNFNIRFYVLALLFIIFDVEIAFMLPVAVVFKQWIKDGSGALALAEIAVFILILLLGLVYAWIKGDLEWVKKVVREETNLGTALVSKASKI